LKKQQYTDNILTGISIETFCREYDDILLGNKNSGSTLLMSRRHGNKVTDDILRYVFEYYLGMTHTDVRDRLTLDILKSLKLMPFVKRIPCPEELDENKDLFYIAYRLYPETRTANAADLVKKVYFEVVDGKRDKYPRLFFDSAGGWARAKICLLAMIGEYLPFSDIGELYAFFADERKAVETLGKRKLLTPLRDMFETPLEYLHESLPERQKSEYRYAMHTDPNFEPEDWQEYWDDVPIPGKAV
jgi:hypothetical protein